MTTTDSLSRKVQNKIDGEALLEQTLSKLDDDIRRLKIDFDIYFNGGTKRPPHEARGRVEAVIKRIGDDRNLSYAQRYQFNSITSRYTSFRELWRRKLKKFNEDIL